MKSFTGIRKLALYTDGMQRADYIVGGELYCRLLPWTGWTVVWEESYTVECYRGQGVGSCVLKGSVFAYLTCVCAGERRIGRV